jgi:hypothetical protein
MSDNWHRRHAIQLACQLPDDASDARAILREVQNLVDTWLHVDREPPPGTKLVSLIRDQK